MTVERSGPGRHAGPTKPRREVTWRAISGESVGSRTDSTNVGNLNPWAGNAGPSIRTVPA